MRAKLRGLDLGQRQNRKGICCGVIQKKPDPKDEINQGKSN